MSNTNEPDKLKILKHIRAEQASLDRLRETVASVVDEDHEEIAYWLETLRVASACGLENLSYAVASTLTPPRAKLETDTVP